jgi:hypothetical protein
MRHALACLAVVLAAASASAAQQMPRGAPIPAAMAQFFAGSWSCRGNFANGKPLAATESFRLVLDGHALEFRHDDTPPQSFHALAIWTVDRASGQLVDFMQDNSGGVRLLVGKGWRQGQLTLTDTPILGHAPFAERFRFVRRDANNYTVSWEVQRGGAWRLGDTSQCQREQ